MSLIVEQKTDRRKAIKYYTTVDQFGNRPILTASEVAEKLGVEIRQLPEEYGRFWAVRTPL